MFAEMRLILNIPPKTDILGHIDTLPAAQQPPAHEAIRDIERRAMAAQIPQPGLGTLMRYLDERAVPKAICTRNFETPVRHLLERFLGDSAFDPILTRDFRPLKPDPAGILHIARRWGLGDASGVIMVGDSMDDMEAGRRAGAATVLLVNEFNRGLAEHESTDLAIGRLDELVGILESGFTGRDVGGGADGHQGVPEGEPTGRTSSGGL
ncbi:hypothetical protein E4U42_004791 [Claviceps africana]|uniref:Uncharacterized protein n=1 Tax=Claviceps africana TaxID=83212 RepID=A0A8K0J4V0_9HYPO|nr:hypothetical protein E4U42_004791 [Claviceps africana]